MGCATKCHADKPFFSLSPLDQKLDRREWVGF